MSEGEGSEEIERARQAGPPRREESWAPEEGAQKVIEGLQRGQQVLEGLRRLRRQEFSGAFSVHSDAGGDLDVRVSPGVRIRLGLDAGLGLKIWLGLAQVPPRLRLGLWLGLGRYC